VTVGELGDGRITDPAAPAGDVLALQTVIASSASGAGKTCTDLAPDGSVVRCHGADALGGVIAIAAGAAHTCALLADTTVECWGRRPSMVRDAILANAATAQAPL
jgi:Regulator of chromosome condensation (RCC1) repeat